MFPDVSDELNASIFGVQMQAMCEKVVRIQQEG
jgi:hypothetical protein